MPPTTFQRELSPTQQEEFYQRCLQTKGGFTGPVIAVIAEDFGLKLGRDAVSRTRRRLLARRHAEFREHTETARVFAAAAQHGVGLNDAAAVKLSLQLNDDLDRPAGLSLAEKNQYALAISRLRAGDQRRQTIALLQARLALQQFDATAAAIKHAKAIHDAIAEPSADASARTERVRQILFGERPANWTPVETKDGNAEELGGEPQSSQA